MTIFVGMDSNRLLIKQVISTCLLTLIFLSVSAVVQAEIRLDKLVRVEITKSYPRFNAKTGHFDALGTLQNTSAKTISAPVALVVTGFIPKQPLMRLLQADGFVPDGNAYQLLLKKGQLAAGAKQPFTLHFGTTKPTNNVKTTFKFQYRVVQFPAANRTPIADAGADRKGTVGVVVALNGSKSSDSNRDTLKYAWVLNSVAGSKAKLSTTTGVSTGFIPDKAGDYTVRLKVNDGYVQSLPDTVKISVTNKSAINHNPVITSYAPDSATATTSFTYEVTAIDADKDKLTYTLVNPPSGMTMGDDHAIRWSVPDKPHAHIPVTLKVTDGKGGVAIQDFSIHIMPCTCK
jgi:hypothetical protein